MTDNLDEKLFSAAKLTEVVRGDLDGDERLHPHTAVVDDDQDRAVLSFVESIADDLPAGTFEDTQLGEVVTSKFATDQLTRAVVEENPSLLAYASGVTDEELTGGQLRLATVLLSQLENSGAPAFVTLAGNPNSGKTNTASLLVEMRDYELDDLLVLSNVRSWDLTDTVVTSAHDLAVQCLEHRDRPKAILLDEASTSFDARNYRREVAQQYTPLAKRYAKIGVDLEVSVCHTGKDLHPERKRLTTLACYKTEPDQAQFYQEWKPDADFPSNQLIQGDVDALEPTTAGYDPDDAAPWAWDLQPELFAEDLDWDDLLDELRSRGPAE